MALTVTLNLEASTREATVELLRDFCNQIETGLTGSGRQEVFGPAGSARMAAQVRETTDGA